MIAKVFCSESCGAGITARGSVTLDQWFAPKSDLGCELDALTLYSAGSSPNANHNTSETALNRATRRRTPQPKPSRSTSQPSERFSIACKASYRLTLKPLDGPLHRKPLFFKNTTGQPVQHYCSPIPKQRTPLRSECGRSIATTTRPSPPAPPTKPAAKCKPVETSPNPFSRPKRSVSNTSHPAQTSGGNASANLTAILDSEEEDEAQEVEVHYESDSGDDDDVRAKDGKSHR